MQLNAHKPELNVDDVALASIDVVKTVNGVIVSVWEVWALYHSMMTGKPVVTGT